MRFRLPRPRELPKRAQLRDLVDIFPPVYTVGEAIRRFLSFEYAEGVWWFDDPSHAPADLAAGCCWIRMRMASAMIRMARTIETGRITTSLV